MADLIIWLRDEIFTEAGWDIFSNLISESMQEKNQNYFKKVLAIVG